jgi:integrase
MVAIEAKAKGGPKGKWLRGRDTSIIQRVDHVTRIVGHIDIAAFKREHFQLIVDDLIKRPPSASNKRLRGPTNGAAVLSNASINRYLNAASAVLTFAVKAEYRMGKPETPLLFEEKNPRAILTSYEAEAAILRVMEANGDRVEALCVRVLVQSGMREGELLKWLQPRQITIETDGEQNEFGRIDLEDKQTKNNEGRKAYIDAQLARDLRAVMVRGELPGACHLLDTFKRAAKACGEPENLLIHSLRHTSNTRMRKEGVDIDIRMKIHGHKTVKTSQRYDRVDDGDQLAAAKKVLKARGDKPETAQVLPFGNLKSAG